MNKKRILRVGWTTMIFFGLGAMSGINRLMNGDNHMTNLAITVMSLGFIVFGLYLVHGYRKYC